MNHQIQQAVEIALSGTADPTLKTQAFEFINQIKSTQEGYQSSVNILLNDNNGSINEGLKFFIYQVIHENIENLNEDQLFSLNNQIFKKLSQYISNEVREPSHLKNKFSQIFSKMFCSVYLNINTNFLKDVLLLTQSNNQIALDYYTRILIGIHSEIGDKYIVRSQEFQDRVTLLKDAIRNNDMTQLVESWKSILTNSSNNDEILDNTLKIVGSYVTWMEISLFVSPQFINTILSFLKSEKQKNTTSQTIIDILSKKMPPKNKLELISLLNLTDIISSIDLKNDDLEFMENISKLLNQIGLELLFVLENDATLVDVVKTHLYKLWPLIFTFLDHEYDDVSQCTFPFIQHFLFLSKKIPQLYSYELLSTLLDKIVLKMKFDDDDDGEDLDELQEFNEFRQKLKLFQDSIASLMPTLFIERIPVIINDSLFGNTTNWRNIELGLYELSNFSDILRNNILNIPKDKINNSEPYLIFQNFLIKLINSTFIIKHKQIQSIFFELVIKHYSFLNQQKNSDEIVIRILEIFTSPLGLFNENEKTRLRVWYLFFRFIKLTKPRLNNEVLIENIITNLQPLLIIKAELPTKDEDDDVVQNGNFSNQQYLFETIGLLISLIPENLSSLKSKLIDIIFQPIFYDLEQCITMHNNKSEQQPLIILQAHHSLMALGTIARGYDYEQGLKFSPNIIEKVNNAAQVVLITLENFSKFESVRDSSRFAFARFIPILKNTNDVSSHLTKLITLIWSNSNLKMTEISDFLSFLGQIIHNYKTDENIYQLLNNFLTPLFQKIFHILNESFEEDSLRPDIIRDKNFLKKSLLTLIHSIITNHLSSLLITETNKQEFPEVMSKLFEYAYDLNDSGSSKLSIQQLTHLVNIFGNSGGKINDDLDKFGQTLSTSVEGIDEFLMEKIVQLSFELPFQKQEFNPSDAQYRLIAQDIAILLKTYQLRKNDEFLKYLSSYLINMGLSQDLTNDFCNNLINLDLKDFKKYFVTFINKMKGGK
ncbi:unnamed protein product [Candida verbasci]|uniref:Exportin-T n=1 Tax=Candida verbasci TaxID=1227364 RepID=A0A9W4TXU7_9ASCO|nr:unnamed protein product [Candida verbasci]